MDKMEFGCGSADINIITPSITLNINTTTGGVFTVELDNDNSIDNLKKIVSKKLKVSKDRICLLHRERELQDGTIKDNGLMDGSKIILIPNVETGLLAQRPENTVMQALESLNDNQVNDFLSGKSPLNLSMRLGDHMMLIQLQLSTLNPASSSSSQNGGSSRSRTKAKTTSPVASTSSASTSTTSTPSTSKTQRNESDLVIKRQNSFELDSNSQSASSSTPESPVHSNELNFLTKQEIENLHNIVKSLTDMQAGNIVSADEAKIVELVNGSVLEQSPIKSLSNLVSSPIKTTPMKNIPIEDYQLPSTSSSSSTTDPISAKLTSCLCKRLDANSNCDVNCQSKQQEELVLTAGPSIIESSTKSSLHKTANNPISKHRIKPQNVLLRKAMNADEIVVPEIVSQTTNEDVVATASTSSATPTTTTTVIDTRALAEASRNLTQTLRKLSKEVFTNKMDVAEDNSRRMGTGAVIESMKHHGKGIYSGTFSGTLNPALQDRYGRPKRDISTIIHILNDLLSATPQYRRGARISFEPTASQRNAIKQVPLRRQSQSQTEQEQCTNCSDSTKTSSCPYGECKGHSATTKTCQNSNLEKMQQKTTCCFHEENTNSSNVEDSSIINTVVSDLSNLLVTATDEDDMSNSSGGHECLKCSRTEIENNKTKYKLDQLRMVMQQKKQRREARKMKSSPYARLTAAPAIGKDQCLEEVEAV